MVKVTGSAIEFSATNKQTSVYPAVGTILLWGGAANLTNTDYLVCDGSSLQEAAYPDLYDIIGTRYNPSAPAGFFNLPNLRERIPIGANNTTNVQYNSTYTGGTDILSNNAYYPHTHAFNVNYFIMTAPPIEIERFGTGADRIGVDNFTNTNTVSNFIAPIGSGDPLIGAQNYYPQYTLVNYIIRAKYTPYLS
jgi:microcystin-dependent protein